MARGGGRLIWRRARAGPAELIGALPTPLLVIGPDEVVREANPAAEALLNLGRPLIEGRPISELIGQPLAAMPVDASAAAYAQMLRLPDGRSHIADLCAAPLPEHPGLRVLSIHAHAPTHLAGRRIDREGGMLTAVGAAAMLAHEIKNPLSAIRGAAQLLDGNDRAGGDLTRLIRQEVDRIAALIDRMEGFADTRPLDLAPLNIHAVLSHARGVALAGFARARTIGEAYDPSLPEVPGHRDTLIQVFVNLLKNAAEASESSNIMLTTAYRHGTSRLMSDGQARRELPIEVCVVDDGPGAPPGLAEHLFDPFVSGKRAGGGLGLALVDKLVADHGGLIEYAREGRPPRTVFRLRLPRVNGAAAK